MAQRTNTAAHGRTGSKRGRGARSATITPRAPTQDEIERRAHELYVQSGYQSGREVEFWLEAERQLKEEIRA
jgi:hypothetical protein